MCSHHRSKDSQRSSKFTAHAAVQLQRRHNNSTSRRYDEGQMLEDLGHQESVQLERLVHETFPRCNVDLIHVVNDPQMYGMYLLRKEEMRYGDKERILYHVTTMSRALESLKNGLDWRRTGCSKLFGCGVSFSDDADYANYYADHSPKEESRVIIVCAVLVNKTQRESGNRNLIVLSGNADTTVSSNGRAYVKYNDYDFYPMYLMYYRRTPEHLNESKYFRNNPHDKWQQNTRVMHQQQQKKQQELKAQREREQAQRQQERKQVQRQQELRAQQEREQAQRQREKAQRQQELRAQREQQQAQCQQDLRAQQEREQEQSQQELWAQREREQAQRQREQAQRQKELRAQREREQEQRQQELRAQREKQQAQRQQERQQAQCQQDLRAQKEREQEQRQQELRAQPVHGQGLRDGFCRVVVQQELCLQEPELQARRRLERDQEQLYSRMLTSEFTRHAAPYYSERVYPFMHHHIFCDLDRPLLNELNSNAYNDVEQLVKSTFPNCNIDQIRLVHAPQMNGMYMLRREEMKLTLGQSVQEKLLFHVTTKSRAMESLKSGLDWRRTKRKKFGHGVSFSDDADCANYYSDKRTTEKTRVIMICNVLVSETYVVPKKTNVNSFDQGISSGRVYVKYNDNDFYPLYFVYYQRRLKHMTESKYFRFNTRQAKDCHDLDAKGYYEDDDYSNELNGVDIYDYLDSKGIYDYDYDY